MLQFLKEQKNVSREANAKMQEESEKIIYYFYFYTNSIKLNRWFAVSVYNNKQPTYKVVYVYSSPKYH